MTLIVRIENDEALFEEHEEDGRTSSEPHTNPDSFTIAQLRARVHRKMMRTHSPQDTKKNKEEKQ
jgi:hypothetical protein